MSYVVGEKVSTMKGKVAEGEKPGTFKHRYIYEEDDKGVKTGNWNPKDAVEAFAHYMELTGSNELQAKADMLFLINRRFYFDEQPGADQWEVAARNLSKKMGFPISAQTLKDAAEAQKAKEEAEKLKSEETEEVSSREVAEVAEPVTTKNNKRK